ncbi:MAG: NAD(P)/FAD-dependent oxidoreductase [Candidatus Eisenbacteria bacterium]|uniref:NAD(P)/FAD-dependent oxidoreductase n=1 Tax=Eiseniibacteriota bacterium TaxID=2212470 RepID=A0A538U614_UNCEI|nr:MAG: NAD(P)/FAD-dependent oxidoreductase [Candidatus Eisenbacteria bacterium]
MKFPYVIVGGGLAAAGAIDGIREHDRESPILLISRENHRPYQRPPLTKDLWFGKTTLDKIPYHEESFYASNHVEVLLRREAVELDSERRRVWDDHGTMFEYGRLLLATGGFPRRLNVPGGDHASITYYRYLEDYLALRDRLERIGHVLVVGGGFIGMELAAAVRHAGKELHRVLPRDLGLFVADYYRQQGVETVSEETVARFEDHGAEIVAQTAGGNMVTTQLVIAGVGIAPTVDLAEAAGLEVGNGIEVDDHARTSDPYIYATGDVAEFPYLALERRMRVEHWDHAIQHGKAAGANMAGANKPYDYMPFFYSDLFDLGWEAVGEIDSELETHAVWKQEYREGVVYYLRDEVVRGVLLWNTWNAVDWARGLIREGTMSTREEREAAVPA